MGFLEHGLIIMGTVVSPFSVKCTRNPKKHLSIDCVLCEVQALYEGTVERRECSARQLCTAMSVHLITKVSETRTKSTTLSYSYCYVYMFGPFWTILRETLLYRKHHCKACIALHWL